MVAPGVDDASLVEAARAGDSDAFAAMFDRYAPRVHAFCTRLLNEPHTAADATQDTFVTAARRLDQLRDPSKLRPWLYAIARNECTRHGRARARAVPVEDIAMSGGPADLAADEPASHASAAEAGELIWAAADGLDEKDRVLLELQVRHGLEGQELAEAAGVPTGQISMATGRMRERVERSIGALLVARGGRKDCPGLAVTLEGWDGTFSVLMRKRVARHIDACEQCEERRAALVAPLGSLALAPVLVPFALSDLPDGLRGRTVDAMGAARGAGAAASVADDGWTDGFPPPLPETDDEGDGNEADELGVADESRAGRRRALFALVVLLVVIVIAGAIALGGGSNDDQVTSAASDSTTTDAGTEPPIASTIAVDATTTKPVAGSETTAPANGATTETTLPVGEATTTTTTSAQATIPPTTAPPVTLVPPTTTTPNQAPVLSGLTRSGSATMQTTCNPANSTRSVRVTVSDDRGIAKVVLHWVHAGHHAGQKAMTRSGITWTATLGPFDDPGGVTFQAVATDTDGRSATSSSASVTVDPCPG